MVQPARWRSWAILSSTSRSSRILLPARVVRQVEGPASALVGSDGIVGGVF